MAELRKVRIGDLGRVVTGKTPPSSQPELFGELHPFLTPTDIDGFARYIEPARFLSPEGRDYQHRLMLPERAVCVVCIGATIGKVCMTDGPSFTNQQINSVVVNEHEHDPFFVYHLMTTLRDELKSNAGGAATPIINKTAFSEIEVAVPPLLIQRRIAGILSAYDELIENSQRRIKILEAMARALYREWFVHFRFPGHESVPRVPSPLGDIPQGWEVKPFTEVADVMSGGTPKTDVPEYWNGEIPFFTPRDAPDCFYVQDTDKHVTALGLSKCASELYTPDTVFITARGTVGKVAIPSVPMAMNQSCYALRGKPGFSQRFVFLMTLQQVDYLKTNTGGATFDTIVVDTFRRMEVVRPARNIIANFSKQADAIFDQVNTLQRQVQNLRRTRDLLLPRLLSGQIDVEAMPT
jgi:type I restriction enzyme S subunit